jgi:iron-sulfur cluster insertion protein
VSISNQSTTEGSGTHTGLPEGPDFAVSASAAARILELLKDEKPGTRLRVSVSGGGCSGFQYLFDFDTQQNADDRVFEKNGAAVLVDAMSMEFLKHSELDYVETLGESYFQVKNPNATARCGCGNSFAV